MRPEALLAGVAVVALAVAVALAVVVPGFVAEPSPDEPPARFDLAETTLETSEITGETATLDVTAFVNHRGGPAENVTVVVRATGSESGLLEDTAEHSLDTVDSNGEREFDASVTVPREGGYEIQTILYVDGERVDQAAAEVRGLEALTPPHAASSVEFHELGRQPAVEYAIAAVEDDEVTLAVTSSLTNGGDDFESDLRLVVTARHAEANVVADRAETSVGTIEPGRTASTEVDLTVPDDANYYLDATLWRDGVAIESTRAAANLDPQQTISVDETRETVQFEAGEFETARADRPPQPEPDEDAEAQPGFGIAAAVLAVFVGLAATRRWSA